MKSVVKCIVINIKRKAGIYYANVSTEWVQCAHLRCHCPRMYFFFFFSFSLHFNCLSHLVCKTKNKKKEKNCKRISCKHIPRHWKCSCSIVLCRFYSYNIVFFFFQMASDLPMLPMPQSTVLLMKFILFLFILWYDDSNILALDKRTKSFKKIVNVRYNKFDWINI